MIDFIKNALEKSRRFNLLEIMIFKFYLISVSIIFSIWFPIIISLNLYFYLLLFLILDILTIFLLIKKQWNFVKKIFSWKKWYKIFKNYSMFDFWLFKITVASFWLLLVKLFPVFLSFHIWIYLTIFWFWAGYFICKAFNKEK